MLNCNLCINKYLNLNLKGHERAVHSTERPYMCGTCRESFATSTHLRNHQKKHGIEKPEKCLVCQEAFKSGADLNNHMKMSHPHARPYKCKVCDMDFNDAGSFRNHNKTHSSSASANEVIYCACCFHYPCISPLDFAQISEEADLDLPEHFINFNMFNIPLTPDIVPDGSMPKVVDIKVELPVNSEIPTMHVELPAIKTELPAMNEDSSDLDELPDINASLSDLNTELLDTNAASVLSMEDDMLSADNDKDDLTPSTTADFSSTVTSSTETIYRTTAMEVAAPN